MKSYGRQPYRTVMAALLGATVAFASGVDTAFTRLQTDSLTKMSDSAIGSMRGCPAFKDLKKRIPEFSNLLVKLGKAKDTAGIARTYDSLYKPVRDVADLELLGQALDEAQTRKEKLAVIFLALPLLNERADCTIWDGIGSPEYGRKVLEEAFMRKVWDTEGLMDVSALLRCYWYKSSQWPPNQEDKRNFFRNFADLF